MGGFEIVWIVVSFAFWAGLALLATAIPVLLIVGLAAWSFEPEGHPAGCLLAVILAFIAVCVVGYCNINCRFEKADRANQRMHQLLD